LFLHFAAWPVALEAIAKVLRALHRAQAMETVSRDIDLLARQTAARLSLPASVPNAATRACIQDLAATRPSRMAHAIIVAHALRQSLV
jgi:hypothetical protein